MTTEAAAPAAVWYKIVVCGTCDGVFREHAGRPTCPACGGPPMIELFSGEIPLEAPAEAPSGEGEAPASTEGEPPPKEPATKRRRKVAALREES
jgi:hypothetical protein